MNMSFVRFLDGTSEDRDRLLAVGGKGAALEVMVGAGLPIPATAAVTTAAYRHVAATPGVVTLLASLAGQGVADRTIEDADVDAAFAACSMNDRIRTEIVATRRALVPNGPVAVRSSATTEDLGGASFAGQYLSVLGVESDEELLDAVTRVWASLWHRAPRLYRQLHAIPDDRAEMAVLIQEMVPAVAAGVVFTVDPGGSGGDLRVERVDGLGEALVSGDVTPTVHLLPRTAPLARSDTDDDVCAAGSLAMRCEQLFGAPQDVEWADDGSRVWIVQSRPITTGEAAGDLSDSDGFNSPVGAHRRYTTAGVAEMLPGVLPTLVWSTAGFMVEEAYRTVTERLGALPATIVDDNGFVVRTRGRAALDLDHMNDVARALPGGSPEEVEEQFFGTRAWAEARQVGDDQPPPSRLARIRHDVRLLRANRTARIEHAVTRHAIDIVLDATLDVAAASDDELLAARMRLTDLGARATVAEFSVAAAAVAAFRRLEATLGKFFGRHAGIWWALRVTTALRPDTVVQRSQDVAARLTADQPDVVALTEWSEVCARLEEIERVDLLTLIEGTAERGGCQRVIAGRTWTEEPDAFWRLVQGAAEHPVTRSPSGSDLADLEAALVGLPGWRRTRVLTGQFVDIRRQMVRRLVRNAVELLEQRETAKALLLGLGGRIRRIDIELGRRLVLRGSLFHESDIEHLHPSEVRDLVETGRPVRPDVVLSRRRCVERWRAEADLPLTFTGHPTAVSVGPPTGDRLDGWGASPGRHTGPVKFLRSPDDAIVEPGDVVVARRTDASWSPVFLRAAAVIVEEGGPLSHAAIVAREFGLPAVVNVPGATARLRHERAPVTVDGDRGLVFVASSLHVDDVVPNAVEVVG